jgi:hypothetical protein
MDCATIDDVLWWLGTGEYSIGNFVSGYGLLANNGGGKWGAIPQSVLDEMVERKLLYREGGMYYVTWKGRTKAATIYYNLQGAE